MPEEAGKLEGKQELKPPCLLSASDFASWVSELHGSRGASPRSKQFIPVCSVSSDPRIHPSVPEMAACPTLPAPRGPSSQLLSVKNCNFPLGSIFLFPGLQNLVNSH